MAKIEKMRDGAHKNAGHYDRAQRWYPWEAYEAPGTFNVRSPSRAWPYGYLKHFYTVKYARLLFKHAPRKYMMLQDIDEKSDEGKALIALYAAQKMGANKK